MELKEFCEGIGLMPEAARALLAMEVPEAEYQAAKAVFDRDKKAFYDRILNGENARMMFLYLYSRMGCETCDRYVERGIGRDIFFDTFRDLTYWCENCFREYGEYGINEYHWFFRHVELRIFRLGRLQFEKLASEWEFSYRQITGKETAVKKGDPVISIHIPQGERLDVGQCRESIRRAFDFWGEECPYLCYSWLLDESLKQILPQGANILKFQELFSIVRRDTGDRYGEWRIFGRLSEDPSLYPENTTLQKNVRRYLMEGGQIGTGLGVLLPPDKA